MGAACSVSGANSKSGKILNGIRIFILRAEKVVDYFHEAPACNCGAFGRSDFSAVPSWAVPFSASIICFNPCGNGSRQDGARQSGGQRPADSSDARPGEGGTAETADSVVRRPEYR